MNYQDENQNVTTGTKRTIGLSLFSICFILSMIFMVLKLCNVITWTWVMVFLPLIIYAGIAVLFWVVIITIVIIIACISKD